jgi:hypothetical protein
MKSCAQILYQKQIGQSKSRKLGGEIDLVVAEWMQGGASV